MNLRYFFCGMLMVVVAYGNQPLPFNDSSVRVEYVVDSFDDEKIESVIPRSTLESIIQSADGVYFGNIGECSCGCAGGDIYFYGASDSIPSFFSSALMDRICTSISGDLVLIWKLKNQNELKIIIDSLKVKKK